MYPKHNEDFYGWVIANASLLKQGKLKEVDMENIIEELEEMGRSEKYQLINRFSILIAHLLKWQFQPTLRGHSWIYTIREQRKQVRYHLEDNPSLKNKLEEILIKAYNLAIDKAARDTSLSAKNFSTECSYSLEQIISEEFYPD